MPSEPLIQLRDVHLAFADNPVLRGIDLDVQAGQAVSIIGPSGSGKSTILRCMTGLLRPQRGSICIGGTQVERLRGEAELIALRKQVGFVFQSFQLLPAMTALENVMLPLELAAHPEAHRIARELLARVGLAERAGHYPRTLSGGEQQRVALARAFASSPRLLFADEPTGSLDHATGERVIDLLFEMNRDFGATLILVTHDPRLAARCGRRLEIERGRLKAG